MSRPTRAYILTHRTATLTPSHKLSTFSPLSALTIYSEHHDWHTRYPHHNKYLYIDSITDVHLPFFIYAADNVDIPFMSADLCGVQEYMKKDVRRRAGPPLWTGWEEDTDRGVKRRVDWGDRMEFRVWEIVEVVMGEWDERSRGEEDGRVYYFGGESGGGEGVGGEVL